VTSFVLLVAAILTFAIGLVHSYLGEKYILIRLFRRKRKINNALFV